MTVNRGALAGVGARIREERRAAGMTREEFAEAAGVSGPTVTSWEYGYRDCGVARLVSIAGLLGVPASVLLPGDEAAGEEAS